MAQGFRPTFYNRDPVLHSIEILSWAASRDSFTLREMLDRFNWELLQYKDAQHEGSERLRKLIKSGMIVVITRSQLSYLQTIIETGKKTWMTSKEVEALEKRLVKISSSVTAGRKPRLYCATKAGTMYVESRAEDLKQIFENKEKKNPE